MSRHLKKNILGLGPLLVQPRVSSTGGPQLILSSQTKTPSTYKTKPKLTSVSIENIKVVTLYSVFFFNFESYLVIFG